MKLTKSQLKQIIKEELTAALNENNGPNPYVEGEGLGTPDVPGAPLSSKILSVIWGGFGYKPSDAIVVAVIADDWNVPEEDVRAMPEVVDLVDFAKKALLKYAETEGWPPLVCDEAELEEKKKKGKGKWMQDLDPEHKGYCTPMTKKTCTPKRKALAQRFKKAARKKKKEGGTGWQGKV